MKLAVTEYKVSIRISGKTEARRTDGTNVCVLLAETSFTGDDMEKAVSLVVDAALKEARKLDAEIRQ